MYRGLARLVGMDADPDGGRVGAHRALVVDHPGRVVRKHLGDDADLHAIDMVRTGQHRSALPRQHLGLRQPEGGVRVEGADKPAIVGEVLALVVG